jgi:multiple sugar transport system permease protein
MIGVRRRAVLVTAIAAAVATAVLAAARWEERRFDRTAAVRIAASTAAYVAIVTPAARGDSAGGGGDYNLAQLLAQARALTTLPGWTSPVEFYHRTAPLVDAAAPPLPVAALERTAGGEPRWREGAVLVPLRGPSPDSEGDGDAVVGVVAVRPNGRGGVGFLLLGWAIPGALLFVTAAAAAGFRRQPRRQYVAAAALLGLAAYADVRGAARRSTDRWLDATRLLMQEAATRLPGPRARVVRSDLAPVTLGAELLDADSTTRAPRRIRAAGATRAVVAVRLGSGRWVQVRTSPAEAGTGVWLVALLGLALVGPVALVALEWAERTAAQRRVLRETATAWGFLAPAALHLAVFSVGPVLFVLYLSVHGASGGPFAPARPYVGLANFLHVLRDPLVWVSLRNTLVYALYVPVSMALALAVALVLNRAGRSGRVALVLRAAFLLPYMSSVVAVALVWQALAGLGPRDWFGSQRTALLALMLLSIWSHVGVQMMVFLTGLQRIPQAYLDAARVDGANTWQGFWRVTFPLLQPVTLFVLVTGVIGAVQMFTYVYVLTGGGPLHATDVVVHRLYQTGWDSLQFGPASALSLLVFLLLFGVTWMQFRLLGREVEHA